MSLAVSASPIARRDRAPFEGSPGRLHRVPGPTLIALGASVAVVLAAVAARSSSATAVAVAGAAAFAIGLVCQSLASRRGGPDVRQPAGDAQPDVAHGALPAAEGPVRQPRSEARETLRDEDVARTVLAVAEDLRGFPVFAEIVTAQMASVTEVSEGAATYARMPVVTCSRRQAQPVFTSHGPSRMGLVL